MIPAAILGSLTARTCASCGNKLRPEARFCDACAHPVDERTPARPETPPRTEPHAERAPADYTPEHFAEKILSSKHALEGERKQVTVLFADAPLPQPRRAGGAPSDPAPGGGRSAVTIQR
jgi:hypothetical protein